MLNISMKINSRTLHMEQFFLGSRKISKTIIYFVVDKTV